MEIEWWIEQDPDTKELELWIKEKNSDKPLYYEQIKDLAEKMFLQLPFT